MQHFYPGTSWTTVANLISSFTVSGNNTVVWSHFSSKQQNNGIV